MTDSPSPSPSPNSHKRPRSDTTTEERKEARAHRNRIAAQNSRDRRKAQFAYLERRVAELEEENRALRAQRGVCERDRENEELKERIKTLERGWDAVIKALAVQGLPLATPTPLHSRVHSPPSTGGDHRPAVDGPAAGELDLSFPPSSTTDPDDAAMENLLLEILASPLPADPATPSPAAATSTRSAAQTAASVQAQAEVGPDATKVASLVPEELEMSLGLGATDAESMTLDLGLTTITSEQQQQGWDNGLEMQRILASLGVVDESQPTELEIELGWPTFGVDTSVGVNVF